MFLLSLSGALDLFLKGIGMPSCYLQDTFTQSWLWLGTRKLVGTQDWSKRGFNTRNSSCGELVEPSLLSDTRPHLLSVSGHILLTNLIGLFPAISLCSSLAVDCFMDSWLLDLPSIRLILIVFTFVYMASGLFISCVLRFLYPALHLII